MSGTTGKILEMWCINVEDLLLKEEIEKERSSLCDYHKVVISIDVVSSKLTLSEHLMQKF